MNALKHIRTKVFGLTQQEFAAIAGVQQSTISRWENGEAAPTLEEMNRIRAEAANRKTKLKAKWNDQLFFAAPQNCLCGQQQHDDAKAFANAIHTGGR